MHLSPPSLPSLPNPSLHLSTFSSTSEQTHIPNPPQAGATAGWNFSPETGHLAFTLTLCPDKLNSKHLQHQMAADTRGLREPALPEGWVERRVLPEALLCCQSSYQPHPLPGHIVSSRPPPGRSLRADLPQLWIPRPHTHTPTECHATRILSSSLGLCSDHTRNHELGPAMTLDLCECSDHHLRMLGKSALPMCLEELNSGILFPDTRSPQSSQMLSASLDLCPTLVDTAVSFVI